MLLRNLNIYSEDELKRIKAFEWEVMSYLNDGTKGHGYCNFIVSLYIVNIAGSYNLPSDVTLEMILKHISDENIAAYVKEYFSEETWNNVIDSAVRNNIFPHCKDIIINSIDEDNEATPHSLCSLVAQILEIGDDEYIADMGCGTGNFLFTPELRNKKCALHGFELRARSTVVASIRNEIAGKNAVIHQGDFFSLLNGVADGGFIFDKVFSNYPFGIQLKHMHKGKEYLEKLTEKIPSISKATSSDWVFNSLLLDVLKPDGKAVGVMTVGSAFNTIDTPARKYFIENGFIEALIALPRNLFHYTGIPTILIVLSHGNDSVRFVDARELCDVGRRYASFTDSDISDILEAYKKNGENSKEISCQTIKENDYVLSPERYFSKVKEFENGVEFQDVILNITRGASITAKELDSISSEQPTQYQYLMLKNINKGVISTELPYITGIEKKYEKYCLKNNSLILSKNGYPYKVAVASIKGEQKVLASGNMYVIQLDEEKVDPYYLKSFFESEIGINVLKSITVGATIPNIGVDNLKKIKIPIPSMEEQKKVSTRYQATLDEITVLQIKLEKAQSKLLHIFDEESEG